MTNTIFEYHYKEHVERIIFEGVLDGPRQRDIRRACRNATDFIPIQVGLPFPTPDGYVFTVDDTPYCTLSDPAMVPTTEDTTLGYGHIEKLHSRFVEVMSRGWETEAFKKILEIPEPPQAAQKRRQQAQRASEPKDLPAGLSMALVTHVALLTQRGTGCDYTIGCGKKWVFLSAVSDIDALNQLREPDADGECLLGAADSDFALAEVVLLRVDDVSLFDIEGYYRDKVIATKDRQTKEREKAERQHLRQLLSKYPDMAPQADNDDWSGIQGGS